MFELLIAKSMKYYALNLAANGNEDGQVHCSKAGQPCEYVADEIQSQQDMIRHYFLFANCDDVEDGSDHVDDEEERCICITVDSTLHSPFNKL